MKNYIIIFTLVFCMHLFSTPIIWNDPIILSSSGVNASNSQIEMDGDSNSVAIWLEGSALVSATQLLNQSWSSITTIVVTGASDPRLVVDSSGNATALWLEKSVLKTSTKLFGGSWSAEETLSSSASEPQIAVRSNGDVTAVWVESSVIKAAIKTFGGAWPGTADTLSSSGADTPQVAIGNEGTVVVVWHNVVATLDTILSATTTIGSAWEAETTISSSDSSINPAVTVDVDGGAMGSWFTFSQSGTSFSNVLVNVATKEKGASWQTPLVLSDPGVYDPSQLEILIECDSSKNTIILWKTSFDGCNFDIQSIIKKVNETSWEDSLTLFRNPCSISMDLSVPCSKHITIISMDNDGTTTNIQSSLTVINNALKNFWLASNPLNDTYNNGFPKIASGEENAIVYATALWITYDGQNNVLRSSNGLRTCVLPPENLAVVQSTLDFEVFTSIINTVTWSASPTSNLVGYLIYRDSLFLAQVAVNAFTFIDYNQPLGVSVTYEISALSSDNVESPLATVTLNPLKFWEE